MQGGVTKSSVTKSVLERAALSEGKEIGSNAFTAEVSKKLKSIFAQKFSGSVSRKKEHQDFV